MIESRQLDQIRVHHLAFKGGPSGNCVAWWYGAGKRNVRDRTLPLIHVWFRKLKEDGSWGPFFSREVGITDLALLQLGTIWNDGTCRSQLTLEKRRVHVDFTSGGYSWATQARTHERFATQLIPAGVYPLPYPLKDRSEILVFEVAGGRKLLVPSLEFFSRCYGRSAEVNRVLSTYPWSEAEQRLHQPHPYPVPPSYWSVKLPSNIYDDDALFVSHVKYDAYARQTAKGIYASFESQFSSARGLAFPQIGPWFLGKATLIVEGISLDPERFLALRILGFSEPKGPDVWSFRENPGEAEEPAPEGSPLSAWAGRNSLAGDILPLVNVTSSDPANHGGDIVEVRNPALLIVGPRRNVVPQKLQNAKTRPGAPAIGETSNKHSPGERQGAGSATGVASVHTETRLESRGAARDVWEALLHLSQKMPELIEEVGWYSAKSGSVNLSEREPSMVDLLAIGEQEHQTLPIPSASWIYADPAQARVRGVLIVFVKTPHRSAYLFEIERRSVQRAAENGSPRQREQAFCGLIVSPPEGSEPSEWVPEVMRGIRVEEGVMARVISYSPDHLVNYYRRSASKGDEIAGHSTVISALGKVGIDVPHPKDVKRRTVSTGRGTQQMPTS